MGFRKAPTELAQIQSCCTAPAGGNRLPVETLTHHQDKRTLRDDRMALSDRSRLFLQDQLPPSMIMVGVRVHFVQRDIKLALTLRPPLFPW